MNVTESRSLLEREFLKFVVNPIFAFFGSLSGVRVIIDLPLLAYTDFYRISTNHICRYLYFRLTPAESLNFEEKSLRICCNQQDLFVFRNALEIVT